ALDDVADLRSMFPHYGVEQLDLDAGYLIIDESEIETSPWSGLFNSQGTKILTKLLELTELARQRHIVIIFLASDVVDHSSMLVRSEADIIVDATGEIEELPWGEGLHLPVLDVCMKFKRRQ